MDRNLIMKVGDDMFKCFVCFDDLVEPSLCPYCSKIGCYKCFNQCLQLKNTCPNCRRSLTTHSLVKGRWLKEIQEINLKEEKCVIHENEILTVFCETCQMSVCHHCALWSNHSGHVFRPLDEAYGNQLKTLTDGLGGIEKMRLKLIDQEKKMDTNVECLQKDHNDRKAGVLKEVDSMIERLEQCLDNKVIMLTDQKCEVTKHKLPLDKIQQEVEKKMKNLSKKELISQSKTLLQDLNKTVKNQPSSISAHIPSNFINELTPPYDTAAFQIADFFKLVKANGESIIKKTVIHSINISVSDVVWKLVAYDMKNIFRVSFSYQGCLDESCKFIIVLEIVHPSNKSMNIKKTFSQDLSDEMAHFVCYINQLRSFVQDDRLTLKFEVRQPTYYYKCNYLRCFNRMLEKDRDLHKRKAETLQRTMKNLQNLTFETKFNYFNFEPQVWCSTAGLVGSMIVGLICYSRWK